MMRFASVIVGVLLVAAGCGSSSPAEKGPDGGGGNGSAGSTGAGGSAGSAGNAGAGGAAGATGGGGGAAGAAGSAGAAGTSAAGTTGAAGAGGTAGAAGTTGAAGSAGSAGAAGTTGASGATGTAGAAGVGGRGGSAGGGGTSGSGGAAGTAGAAGAAGTAGAGGTTGAAGSGGAGGSSATAYIVADIDGVTVRADSPVAYRHPSFGLGNILVEAGTTEWVWRLVFTNAVGAPTECGIQLAKRGSGVFQAYTSSSTGGSCTANLTRAAPNVGDEVEGTYSGVLNVFIGGTTTTPPITITNGRFRAVRSADQSWTPGA